MVRSRASTEGFGEWDRDRIECAEGAGYGVYLRATAPEVPVWGALEVRAGRALGARLRVRAAEHVRCAS